MICRFLMTFAWRCAVRTSLNNGERLRSEMVAHWWPTVSRQNVRRRSRRPTRNNGMRPFHYNQKQLALLANDRPSPLRVYQGGISLPGLSEIVEAKNRLTAAILRAEPMSEDADDKESSPFLESSAARLPAKNFCASFDE